MKGKGKVGRSIARLGRRRRNLRRAKYFGGALAAVGAARPSPFSMGAGLLTAAAARVGERAFDAWVFRRALGQPWIANKFKEKYQGNRRPFRALELMEWLGPYSPKERRRALLALVRLGKPNMKEIERRAAIAIEAKVTVARNRFEALGRELDLRPSLIRNGREILQKTLPMLKLGASWVIPYECMDVERGIGNRFIVLRRTARGFRVTDEARPPRPTLE